MTAITQCAKCGAQFDSSAIPEGGEFACGACGAVLRVDRPPPPPPLPGRGKRSEREPRRRDDAAKRKGKARVNAAKLCSTAFYAGIAGAIFLLLNPLGAMGGGIVALVCGVWGIAWLAALGPGDPNDPNASPIERVGAEMARRGVREGWSGIGIGVSLLGYYALRFFAVV